MQVKLLRSVLVGDADVMPTPDGTVVRMDEGKAREFIALGLAAETKKAAEPENKMAAAAENKMLVDAENKTLPNVTRTVKAK